MNDYKHLITYVCCKPWKEWIDVCHYCNKERELSLNLELFDKILSPLNTLEDVIDESLSKPFEEKDIESWKAIIRNYSTKLLVPVYRAYLDKIRPLLPLSNVADLDLAWENLKFIETNLRKNGQSNYAMTEAVKNKLIDVYDSIFGADSDFEEIVHYSIKAGIANILNSSLIKEEPKKTEESANKADDCSFIKNSSSGGYLQ